MRRRRTYGFSIDSTWVFIEDISHTGETPSQVYKYEEHIDFALKDPKS